MAESRAVRCVKTRWILQATRGTNSLMKAFDKVANGLLTLNAPEVTHRTATWNPIDPRLDSDTPSVPRNNSCQVAATIDGPIDQKTASSEKFQGSTSMGALDMPLIVYVVFRGLGSSSQRSLKKSEGGGCVARSVAVGGC